MAEETPQNDQNGNIQQVDIDTQMRDAYLDYAMSVIVARALPGCAGWSETCPSPHFVCHAGAGHPLEFFL